MKYFGKKFIVSASFAVAGIVLLAIHLPLYAAFAFILSFALNGPEIKEYASYYQFINFHVHTLLLGYSVDTLIGDGTYYYTLAMVFNQFTGVLRLELFNQFMMRRYAWIEVSGLAGMYAAYIYAGLQHPADWRGWALPAFPVFFMTYISGTVIRQFIKDKKAQVATKQATELGKKAPAFSLPDVEGRNISLSDFENKNHVLLIFVRGDQS